jgi:hypothetical protein
MRHQILHMSYLGRSKAAFAVWVAFGVAARWRQNKWKKQHQAMRTIS